MKLDLWHIFALDTPIVLFSSKTVQTCYLLLVTKVSHYKYMNSCYCSMASVCGGCLALQDAGVPVKCSIAGIAMGLVLDTEEFGGDGTPLILSDITGSEDASGDMDFKVSFSRIRTTIPIFSCFLIR